MITDRDIERLEAVFTKKGALRQTDSKIDTAVRELIDFINISLQTQKREIVTEIRQAIREEISPILFNHEGRLRRLESERNNN